MYDKKDFIIILYIGYMKDCFFFYLFLIKLLMYYITIMYVYKLISLFLFISLYRIFRILY